MTAGEGNDDKGAGERFGMVRDATAVRKLSVVARRSVTACVSSATVEEGMLEQQGVEHGTGEVG